MKQDLFPAYPNGGSRASLSIILHRYRENFATAGMGFQPISSGQFMIFSRLAPNRTCYGFAKGPTKATEASGCEQVK